ncbi:MAG: alpha/beta hydrolase family protein [Candidatus Hodarchaeota archaeon]
MSLKYDPFSRGPFPVGVRTQEIIDSSRQRKLPVEFWYPATDEYKGHDLDKKTQDRYRVFSRVSQEAVRGVPLREGSFPLIMFSHGFGGHKRQTTHFCCHLASHGYIIASPDHLGSTIWDTLEPYLKTKKGVPPEEMRVNVKRSSIDRPLDITFLIDNIVTGKAWIPQDSIDKDRIGMTGHSFGGWTTLVVTRCDDRIRAALPLAPGGGRSLQNQHNLEQVDSEILEPIHNFWNREVPTLFLAAEKDTLLPLPTILDLYKRTPEPKRMIVLNNADHFHFTDMIEEIHDFFRTQFASMGGDNPLTRALAESMLPASKLHPSKGAYDYLRGLGLAHMDAYLMEKSEAKEFLANNLKLLLAEREIDVSIL